MRENYEQYKLVIIAIITIFVISSIHSIFFKPDNLELKEWQAQAVLVGHAKWGVAKNGQPKFEWLATQTEVINMVQSDGNTP